MKTVIIFIILSAIIVSAGLFFFLKVDTGFEKNNGFLRQAGSLKPEKPELPFKPGETLVYDVYYAGLKTGKAVLTFHGEKAFNEGSAYHITFLTTLPLLKDYEQIYAMKDSFLPIYVKRKIEKIGGLSSEEIEESYNQDDFTVTIKKKGALGVRNTTIKKESPIYNAILLTYYCRANADISKDESVKIVLPTQEFDISLSGEEEIVTESGEYKVDVYSGEPSKFIFYLSKGPDRLPVKIVSSTALSYTMVLSSKEILD
jgi:hypothetical protein